MEKVKSICGLCNCECGIVASIENGRLVRLSGDAHCPLNRGAICSKAMALQQLVYDPQRITSPMKKDRSGNWQRIDWETALDEIAEKLTGLQQCFGCACIAAYQGTLAKIDTAWAGRSFLHGINSPNFTSVFSMCVAPRDISEEAVLGPDMAPICDYEKSKYILLFGANPAVSGLHRYLRLMDDILSAKKNGARLVVVDPRYSATAAKADLWVPIKPATDLDFILGLIHVIINEDLYDKDFVSRYCTGFDLLSHEAAAYPPDRVSSATGIAKATILEVARSYAAKGPSCVDRREGVMHQQHATRINCLILALAAICGNVDVPGGYFFQAGLNLTPPLAPPPGIEPFVRDKYPFVNAATVLPEAILGDCSYPLKSLITIMGNPATAWPNTRKVLAALEKLELLISIDLYLNETTRRGHYFLPGTTCLERYWLSYSKQLPLNLIRVGRPVIDPVGDSRPEDDILCDLARRMGVEACRNVTSSLDVINRVLASTGFSAADLAANPQGVIYGETSVGQFLNRGFPTPSGKIELSPAEIFSSGAVLQPPENKKKRRWPYRLIAGFRLPAHYHSILMNLPGTRALYPLHQAEISADIAAEKQLQNGDLIEVTSEQGSLTLPVQIKTKSATGIVCIPHGFGGRHGPTAAMNGGQNVNYLTSDLRDKFSAAPAYRELDCDVAKVATAPRLRLRAEKCTGCMACVVACNTTHHLPAGLSYLGIVPATQGWQIQACHQCARPQCVEACRHGAWTKTGDVFYVNAQRCTGCRDCSWACPYGCIVFNPDENKVGKCSLCLAPRQDQAESLSPACVAACPVSALYVA